MSRKLWIVTIGLLVLILAPFALFEEQIQQYATSALKPGATAGLASLIVGLLAADILLPVPSSLVSTTSGALLGVWVGGIVSFVGMCGCCLVGYLIGAVAGKGGVARFVGEADIKRVTRAYERRGAAILVLFRPIPVLAEASVLFAGVARVPLGRFLVLTSASNLVLSFVYAAIGKALIPPTYFIPVFLSVTVGPFLLGLIAKTIRHRTANTESAPPEN